MVRLDRNAVRNVISGVLIGGGLSALLTHSIMIDGWVAHAPHQPVPARDLIHVYKSTGGLVYFSSLQSRWAQMPALLACLAFVLGMGIGPKKNVVVRRVWILVSARWDADDPRDLKGWGAIAGAATAGIGLWFALAQIPVS